MQNPEQKMEGVSFSQGVRRIKRIKAKDLSITRGDDPRYWKEVKGDGPAELLQVCWLEVKGKTEAKKGQKYVVKFKVSLTEKNSGWENVPVFIMAKMGEKGEDQLSDPIDLLDKELDLVNKAKKIPVGNKNSEISTPETEGSKSKNDDTDLYFGFEEAAKEIPHGYKKFEIGPISKDGDLYFGLYEVWEGNWKSGLLVHEAIVEEADPSASTFN